MLRRMLIVLAVVAAGGVTAAPALAHQAPPGCTRNALALDITKDKTAVRQGDVITYGIFIGNDAPGACGYTGVTVDFTVPGGQPQVVATNINVPAGTPLHQIATRTYTVPAISAPVDLDAHGHAAGTLHDAPIDHAGEVTKDVGTTAFVPSMALTKTGSTTNGIVPLLITYTYTLTNTSPVSPAVPDIPIAAISVSDNLCAPLGYVSGDTNGDTMLNHGETWTYKCTMPFTAAGCYTNVANAGGTTPLNNSPVGSPPASFMVCLKAPPPKAVKPASACVTLPSTHVRVRARELATVRVRVRLHGKNIAKSHVSVRGAGVTASGRTNSKGMVTFHVRPKKSGRLTIKSDQCAVAARVSVKPARQVVSPALPQVTG